MTGGRPPLRQPTSELCAPVHRRWATGSVWMQRLVRLRCSLEDKERAARPQEIDLGLQSPRGLRAPLRMPRLLFALLAACVCEASRSQQTCSEGAAPSFRIKSLGQVGRSSGCRERAWACLRNKQHACSTAALASGDVWALLSEPSRAHCSQHHHRLPSGFCVPARELQHHHLWAIGGRNIL